MALRSKNHRPMTWVDKRRGKTPDYKYATVEEICEGSATDLCNVYGVVFDLKLPAKSRGTAQIRRYYSHSQTKNIQDRNLLVKKEKASSGSYTLLRSDEEIVDKLREWQMQYPNIATDWNFQVQKRICEIKHDDHIFLVCKVINFMEELGCYYVRVWDGTKPTIKFHEYPIEALDKNTCMNVPDGYFVDIAVSVDHSNDWKRMGIDKGSYILLTGLHAYPNPQNDLNAQGKKCSELCLYEGTANGRGVGMAPENELLRNVKNDIENALKMAALETDGENGSQDTLDLMKRLENNPNCAQGDSNELPKVKKAKRGRNTIGGTGFTKVDEAELDDIPSSSHHFVPHFAEELSGDKEPMSKKTKTRHGEHLTLFTSRMDDSESAKHKENYFKKINSSALPGTSDLKLMEPSDTTTRYSLDSYHSDHESATVVIGTDLPLEVKSLKDVVEAKVPLRKSKSFRVKCCIRSIITADDSYVGHYSPNTGIFFPSNNDGGPLEVTEDIDEYIKYFREAKNMSQSSPSEQFNYTESQPASQWQIPSSDGNVSAMERKAYNSEKDGSQWTSMETEKHVVRKRKLKENQFSILYIMQSTDFSPEELLKHKSNYDRIIRALPLGILTSKSPPAIAVQDDVFYYSCPANASIPILPSLNEEAETFNMRRITKAMGSPVLIPRYDIEVTIQDRSSTIERVALSGKSASLFFNGITPQDYFGDKNGSVSKVKTALKDLVENSKTINCIIVKKSRRNLDPHVSEPVYLYEIQNTALHD